MGVNTETETYAEDQLVSEVFDKPEPVAEEAKAGAPKQRWVWPNIFYLGIAFMLTPLGFYYLAFTAKWNTVLLTVLFHYLGGFGITAGAHRLWAHRSYNARLPLRVLLMIMQTIALERPILNWVRDHRVHHKYSETDADPSNAKRGFWYSHVGWQLMTKHPEVKSKGGRVDLSDLHRDPVVVFQNRNYVPLMITFGLMIPIFTPWLFWGENLWVSYVIAITRWVVTLNVTWLVNSVAHMWGSRPYDASIGPVEHGIVSWLTHGEAWHNYHHVFPTDYKAKELGDYALNPTTSFIDFMYRIGQAYDLKTMSEEAIRARIKRTGPENFLLHAQHAHAH